MKLLKELKNQITILFSVFCVCSTIIAAVFLLQKTSFYIKDLGNGVTDNGEVLNTISVKGDGKVYAKPDKAEFSVRVTKTRDTSKQALEEVNKRISKIKERLDKKGVVEKDIQTSNLSIYPDYDWKNNNWVLVGQRASQTLTVSVRNIGEKATKIAEILDEVASVDDVRIFSIKFDIESKKDIFSQARELAFKKAEQKASELAELASVELLDPVSIKDVSTDFNKGTYEVTQTNVAFEYEEYNSQTRSEISSGQLEIKVRLDVKFGIGGSK